MAIVNLKSVVWHALVLHYFLSGAMGESVKRRHDPGIDFNRNLTGIYFDPASFMKHNGLPINLDELGISALVNKIHSQFDHIMVPFDGNSSNHLVPEAVARRNKKLINGTMQVTILYRWENWERDKSNLVRLQQLRQTADQANDIFSGTVKTIILEMRGSVRKPLQQYYEFQRHFIQTCKDRQLQGHQYRTGIQLNIKLCDDSSSSSGLTIWEDVVRYGRPDMIYLFQSVDTQNTVNSVDGYVTVFTEDFSKCKRAMHRVNSELEVGFISTWPDTGLEGRLRYSNLVEFWGLMNRWGEDSKTEVILLQAFDTPLHPDMSMKTNGWWRLIPNSSCQVVPDFLFDEKRYLIDDNSGKEVNSFTLKWLRKNVKFSTGMVGICFDPISLKKGVGNFSKGTEDFQTALAKTVATTFPKVLISMRTSSGGDILQQMPITVAMLNSNATRLGNRSIEVIMTFDETTANATIELANKANELHSNTVKTLIYRPKFQVNHILKAENFFQSAMNVSEMGSYKFGIEVPLELCYGSQQLDAFNKHLHRSTFKMIYFSSNVTPANSRLGVGRIFPQLTVTFQKCKTKVEKYFKELNETMEVGLLTGWPIVGEESLVSLTQFVKFWEKINGWAIKTNTSLFLTNAFDAPETVPDKSRSIYGWWRLDEELSEARGGFVFKTKKDDALRYAEESMNNQTSQVFGPLQISIMVIPAVAFFALSVVAITYYLRKRKSQYLTDADIAEFFHGGDSTAEDELVQNFNSAYDTRFELPETAFQIDESSSLGSGEFGKVCRATIVKEGKEAEHVAVKMAKVPSTRAALRGMIFEVKILSFLGKHDHIVELIGAYTARLKKSKIFVFLELCTLGSLKSYLKNFELPTDSTELDETLASDMQRWAGEIANGMEFIASKHIVHMDLAVRNVLLTADKLAKITDFGLSRRMCNYISYKKSPTEREPLPWRSMAPESLRNREFTEKTDVWSFGVTLWEIFSFGTEPYPGLEWNVNFLPQLESGRLRLGAPVYNLKDMYSLMLRCWNTNPQKRPTFSELARKLYQVSKVIDTYAMPGEPSVSVVDSKELLANLPRTKNAPEPLDSKNKNSSLVVNHNRSANAELAIGQPRRFTCSIELNGWFKGVLWSLLAILILFLIIFVPFIALQVMETNTSDNMTKTTNSKAVVRSEGISANDTTQNGFGNYDTTISSTFNIETKTRESKLSPHLLQMEGIQFLLNAKNDPFAKDAENYTFLHRLLNGGSTLTATDFHELANYLVFNNFTELIEISGGNVSATPLHLAAYNFEMEQHTLILLQKSCVHFNMVDIEGKSVLGYAVDSQRSPQFLSALIRYGADWKSLPYDKRSQLHFAAQVGNLEALKFFLKLGLDINAVDALRNTPLHVAVGLRKETVLDLVKFFVESGANVNARNSHEWTPIISAAKENDIDHSMTLIKYLVEHNADGLLKAEAGRTFLHELLSRDDTLTTSQFHDLCEFLVSKGYAKLFNIPDDKEAVTPFHLAVYHIEVDQETLSFLKQNEVNFNAIDANEETALYYAVRGRQSVSLLTNLIQLGADWTHKNKDGCTLLHSAAKWGNFETVKFLFNKGLSVDQTDEHNRFYPLHIAAQFGKDMLLQTVQFLVKNGASVNFVNLYKMSPLHTLAQNEEAHPQLIMETAKYFIEKGVEINLQDLFSNTFLHYILLYVSLSSLQVHELVKVLLEKGQSQLFNIVGSYRLTPLHLAAKKVELEDATLLLLKEHGVNFNAVDKHRNSILLYSVFGNRSQRLISSLIKFGADPKHLNEQNWTMLHVASLAGNIEAIKVFLDVGLDLNDVDNDKNTPLNTVLQHGDNNVVETVKLLVENGADINATGNQHLTPILSAAFNDDLGTEVILEIIKYLVEKEADVYSTSETGLTFLHWLLADGTKFTTAQLHNISEYLIEKGYAKLFEVADNVHGLTPLHLAVRELEPETATLKLLQENQVNFNLVDRDNDSILACATLSGRSRNVLTTLTKFGADFQHLNNDNQSLLHQGAWVGNMDALTLFIELGLDVNGVDKFGNTVLHYAVRHGKENMPVMVELLIEGGANSNSKNNKRLTPLDLLSARKDIMMTDKKQVMELFERANKNSEGA